MQVEWQRTGYIESVLGAVVAAVIAMVASLLMQRFLWQGSGLLALSGLMFVLPSIGTWVALKSRGEGCVVVTSMLVLLGLVMSAEVWMSSFGGYALCTMGAALLARGGTTWFSGDGGRRRDTRGGRLVAAITLLAVFLAVSVPSFFAQQALVQGWEQEREFALESSTLLARRGALVCAEHMSEACAQEAADRLGATVAWLPEQEGFLFARMAFLESEDDGDEAWLTHQEFVRATGPATTIEVSSGDPQVATGAAAHTRDIDGTSVRVEAHLGELWDTVTLEWHRAGQDFALSVNGGLFGERLTEDGALEVFREIRYAEPAPE